MYTVWRMSPRRTKARLRTEVQDVWQYIVDVPWPTWVAMCVKWNDENQLVLVRGADKQVIEPTEWLIRDLDGKPMWLTDADFQRQYEVING